MDEVLSRLQALELRAQQAEQAAATAQQQLLTAQNTLQQLAAGTGGASSSTTAAGASSTSIVDTRQIGRPNKFKGTDLAEWRSWSFVFTCYCAAVDARLAELMRASLSEAEASNVQNSTLGSEDQARSVQLYYMLVLLMEDRCLCKIEHVMNGEGLRAWRKLSDDFEPDTGGRHAGTLIQLLGTEFPNSDEVVDRLDEFETAVLRYEAQSKEVLSDSLKIAIVQKGLKDDIIRQHLLLNAARLGTYKQVKEEVKSVMVTRRAIRAANALPGSTSVAMDLDAMYKGKGKGKKGKDGKAKGKGKDGKAKGKSKVDEALAKGIKCYFCGKYGHKRADCPKKAGRDTHTPPQQQGQSAASTTASGSTSTQAALLAGAPPQLDWMFMMLGSVAEEPAQKQQQPHEWLLIDSGAAGNACPLA